MDYQRLATLGDKVRAGTATKQERDTYMELLYVNGNITQQQYNDYRAGRNADEILNAALSVGAIILIGYLLKAVFSK